MRIAHSMRMVVVQIGRVVVRMRERRVVVGMRVLAEHGRLVRVAVVAIVVAMRVLVSERGVHVGVRVVLGDGARRADAALRQQVQAQADAIARRTAREQGYARIRTTSASS